MNKIKNIILMLGVIVGVGMLAVPNVAAAYDPFEGACPTGSTNPICKSKTGTSIESYITIIINTILMILGAVSVLVIIIGGVMYTLSSGEATAVKKAKDTILYAVIGLVIAILAYAIVRFVVTQFIPVPTV